MNRYQLKKLKEKYYRYMPSVVIHFDGVQYFCANWSSILFVCQMLGFTDTKDVEHIKFNVAEWYGTDEQLIQLLKICEQAKRDQVNKFGAIGWYVKWSDKEFTFESHI